MKGVDLHVQCRRQNSIPNAWSRTIDSIEEKDILGEKQSYYILKMPSNVKVMIPTAKAEEVGVRNIIDKQSAEKYLQYLVKMKQKWKKTGTKDIEITWIK